eukprot:s422_g16.t2
MAGRMGGYAPLPGKFRLIFADASISGGSIMQMMDLPKPLTLAKVAATLESNPIFKFQDLCDQRGVKAVDVDLRLQGLDGNRRSPLHTDQDIEAFLHGLQTSKIPVIEAQLPNDNTMAVASELQASASSRRPRGRDPRDQIEELEDANDKLSRATDRVGRRLAELETTDCSICLQLADFEDFDIGVTVRVFDLALVRVAWNYIVAQERQIATTDERTERSVGIARREMMTFLEQSVSETNQKVAALKEDDAAILKELDVVRQHSASVEQKDLKHHKDILEQLDAFARRVDEQFDEANRCLDQLKEEDARIDAEAQETKLDHSGQLEAQLEELRRLEEEKVNVSVWQSEGDAMVGRITKDVELLKEDLTKEIAEINGRFKTECDSTVQRFQKEMSEREAGDKDLSRIMAETTQRLDTQLAKMDKDTQAGFQAAKDALQETNKKLQESIDTQVSELAGQTEKHFDQLEHTVDHKDEKVHKRVDELTGKCEATFQSIAERLEAMVQEERDRLGQLNQDLTENLIKARADLYANVERVRSDYEQDAARLDSDLADLHMKYDVTKQEINFFQSKLKDQREWTERCLAESSTATRAAALDSQEGLAATTKMLHALRDDAVSFREKMAKYISILQHSSDQQGEAINSLEINRTRMRAELDALVADHKAYTTDMDDWADDVRVKVERLFRAMEPTQVEWRIEKAVQKAKELRKPLAVKSPTFGIRGIREGHLEFFPDGHNMSPEGKACLRLFLPPQAHIRYQCWVGKTSEGPRERTPGDNLSDAMAVPMGEAAKEAQHFGRVVLQVFANRIVRAASSGEKVYSVRPLDPAHWPCIYGGNIVTCETVQSGPAKVDDYLACLKICTADDVCETYEFLGFSTDSADGGNCTTWSGCDGVYSEDTNELRQVGYCQRINHYPKIYVTESDRTVNIGDTYEEGAVTCTDYEDPYAPDPVTVTEFDNNVAGEYFFQYSCTDQIGQTTYGNRTVTVKANCDVPSGIDNAADTPCEEGSGPFAHGSTCTPVCQEGYTRSLSLMTCTTTSDSDYQSAWDEGTFICGDSECDISTVKGSIKNLAEASTDGEDVPGCVEGDTIVSGATCTPNCKTEDGTSFVASVTSLACDRGNFTPVTYTCNEVAYVPQYVTYSSRDVDAIVVTWAAGNPSDCEFTNWALEYILITSSTGETAWTDYQENPNCGTTALTADSRSSILSCEANTLDEGSGYKFRVREECSNADLNGDWQYSEEITTTTLTPPVTIFYLPNDDVYDSPGSVMVAFDQAVVPGKDGQTVELVKSGENCLASDDGTYNYTKTTSEISTVSLDGAYGMEIAGSRILIITPPDEYWSGSCVYNVSFQQASIYPDTTGTIKELVAFWFNFTYVEEPPTLSSIIRNDTATTSTSISYTIMYDKRTQMNCTAAPKDATTCATEQDTQELSPTAYRRCESRNSTSDMIQELDEPMSFTISDLYPNVEYFVTCSGWIPGKYWVPTVDIADSWDSVQTVTTSEDTETGLSNFMLTVYAVCTDGSIKQIYEAEMKTSEFELGYTAQIDEWIAACQPGVSLELSESVDFIFGGTVWTVSENAYVNWDVGPNHTVTYTKPDDATESAIVTDYLKFTVQSLSYLQGNTLVTNLADYEVLVTVVDIGFTFEEVFDSSSKVYEMISGLSSVAPMYESTGDALPTDYEELVLDVGAEMYFKIKVSQTDFDWSEVSLYLKSITSGYLVNSTYLSADGQIATYQLQHNGQGTQLPFILLWRSAIFVVPIWISFSPPVFSVNVLEASLTAQTTVTVSFSNVPTYVDGTDAFGAPASTMQMYIIKNGYTDNLCGSTTFENTWETGTCALSPGALTDIIIYLKVHNQQQDTFLLVPGDQSAGLSDIISYALPNPTEMASDVPNALREGILDLGMIVNTFPAYIYIWDSASGLPSPAALQLKGAAVAGYKVELVSDGCDAVELCQSITWMNSTALRCQTSSCLDITCLPRTPNVKLYLGDLLALTELEGKINFPRPLIQRISPTSLEDVGSNRYLGFWGLYFSEQSCQSSHAESIQFVSNTTATEITLGEFVAPCTITVQNSTYILCVVVGRVRNVRDESDTVSTVPPALLSNTQTLTWKLVGSLYTPLNGATAVYASEVDPSTELIWDLPDLTFTVNLMTCEAGYRRESDYVAKCVACETGRWITTSETEWPLRCLPCAVGTYQDTEGSSSCVSCPAYTTSPQGASDSTHCTCLPGYFSPYYDDTTGKTTPGTPCTACHESDYMQEVSDDESCGDSGYNVGDLCTARDEDLCVNIDATSLDLRICKLYCPGGTEWPLAKRTFWHLRRSVTTDSTVSGLDAYRPVIQRPSNNCMSSWQRLQQGI